MTAVVETQPEARPALHTCVMTGDAAERHRPSAAFLARGMARGHRAVHVGGQAARRGVLDALRSHGLDVDRARSRGRLHLRSVADVGLDWEQWLDYEHVDLAELRFIDVAGLRSLVRAASGMPEGQRLVLDSVRPHTRRVLALLGWDGLDTMVVMDAPRARA